MLEYLVTSRTRRELLKFVWGKGVAASVSSVARQTGMTFSAVYKELLAMQRAGLATAKREGNELVFARNDASPNAALIQALIAAPEDNSNEAHDDNVRGWLHSFGAPLPKSALTEPIPTLAEVIAEALALAHRDLDVARVLPFVLWRNWRAETAIAIELAATRHNERAALGMFLTLAGELGGSPELVSAAHGLRDQRRTGSQPFFTDIHGRQDLAAAQNNTPPSARQWGFVLNMDLDSFKSVFDKHEARTVRRET